MSPFGCGREREVREMLHRGSWPEGCEAELRGHVDSCSFCSDLVGVTQALRVDRDAAMDQARLGPPGALWWRAQLRRRNEAIEKVARPIVGAHVFALAIALVAAAVLVVWQAGAWSVWIGELPRAVHLRALVPNLLGTDSGATWMMAAGLATVALLSGIVVYFGSEKQ